MGTTHFVVAARVAVWLWSAAASAGEPVPARLAEPPPVAAGLKLDVLLVNDPDFAPVTESDAVAILRSAKATLADKLAFDDVEFRVVGTTSVQSFLAESIEPECVAEFEPYRVRPGGRTPRQIPKDVVVRFLERWSVDALRAFFPEELRAGLGSYDTIYGALVDELARKLEMIRGFKLQNGESLLAPDKLDHRSYTRWICAIRNQNRADLILTNAFILYDLGSEPYPHSIFAKNKVGGASLHSTRRTAIGSRAVFGSTFSMVTDLEFFREEGVETLSDADRLAVIGTFIVAHELGHAVFKLPDFYDHPRECLMTTKYETGYVSGYRDIKQFPGSCNRCQPYVEAKRRVFAAEAYAGAGRHAAAIKELKEAIRLTPKHVDGSYLRYIAGLSVQVAELYARSGNLQQANRWLGSALRIVPDHRGAQRLKTKLGISGE
jgi:tetratricopeptide (TPR) repeat protein